MPAGTYTVADLVASRMANAKAFGLDTIAQVLQADIAAHNALVEEMLSEMCEISTDARRMYGTSQNSVMTEVDEFGRSPMMAVTVGVECGFPLRLYQFGVGWTRKFLDNATVGDLVQKSADAQKAHLRRIRAQIARAIFDDTNYTFTDHLVDNVDLSVRRFLNADGLAIPDGPNGETYTGASHTHYSAAVALAVADITAMINSVVEHGHGAQVKLAINVAQEAAVRALAGFTAYIDPRLILSNASNQPGVRLDISRLDNRAIGILGQAEVWVKPWVPATYYFCWDAADSRKPLVLRHRNGNWALRIAAEFDSYPLQAQYMESEFGVGAWTRTNGACHFSNGAAWADATITD